MADRLEPTPEAIQRALDYVMHLHDYYRSYHDHKETMAYGGMALYVAAFSAAIVSNDWPPCWVEVHKRLGALAITAAWLLVLAFLKFQLLNRRWAALRLAGTDRVLAKWSTTPPGSNELALWTPQIFQKPPVCVRMLDYVWPLRAAVPVVDVGEAVYPSLLVTVWLTQASESGTHAIAHERIFVVAGWALYFALIVRTMLT